MATNFTVSVDEVSCPVCCDIFNNPVILPCSHSLCKGCLQKCWRAGFQKCPLCKRVCHAGSNPPINLVLKNLCERFLVEQEAGGSSETLCSLHGEKLKLFCLVDKQPICADCVPNLHDSHKCCHLKVAVHDHKMKIQAALKPLKEKMEAFREIRATGDQTMKQIKSQAQRTEEEIKNRFQELHRFLHHEETDRVTALRVDEAKRRQILSMKMKETVREMEALSATITTIEQEMGKEDVLFLQNYNDTMKRAQCTVKDQNVSGMLINVAKHLGNLKFQVWEQMLRMVEYTPVILDPNTACSALILSEDLTCVQNIKDPTHCGYGSDSVLGSQGFSLGKHQWDVEVHKDAIIDIGIIKESTEIKKALNLYLSNDSEMKIKCALRLFGVCGYLEVKSERKGKYRIRVLVDCDQKTVSFFDVYGNRTFFTEKYTFTGKLFPFFYFMNQVPEPLTIMPARVKVQKSVQ